VVIFENFNTSQLESLLFEATGRRRRRRRPRRPVASKSKDSSWEVLKFSKITTYFLNLQPFHDFGMVYFNFTS
jgi:hypothetical protein